MFANLLQASISSILCILVKVFEWWYGSDICFISLQFIDSMWNWADIKQNIDQCHLRYRIWTTTIWLNFTFEISIQERIFYLQEIEGLALPHKKEAAPWLVGIVLFKSNQVLPSVPTPRRFSRDEAACLFSRETSLVRWVLFHARRVSCLARETRESCFIPARKASFLARGHQKPLITCIFVVTSVVTLSHFSRWTRSSWLLFSWRTTIDWRKRNKWSELMM